MAKRKPSVTITASIIGAVAVILGAILTPYVQNQLSEAATPTLTLTATFQPPKPITPTATSSPVVLVPTWIDREGSVVVLDNQVLIHVVQINHGLSDSVNLSVTIGTESEKFMFVEPGERVTFQYLSVDYSVTVMQIIGTQTQISVERILTIR